MSARRRSRTLRALAGFVAALFVLRRVSRALRYRAVLHRSEAQLVLREKGRVAVVTGAASGLGLEIVMLLGRRGWRVYAVDVDKRGLEKLALRTEPEALDVCGVQLSVSDATACRRFLETVKRDLSLSPAVAVGVDAVADAEADAEAEAKAEAEAEAQAEAQAGAEWGHGGETEGSHCGVDALVNCAGVVLLAPILSAPWRDVEAQTRVNFLGPLMLMSLFKDLLLLGPRGGNIVNVSSVGGTVGWPWQGAYFATKHALSGCSAALRREALQAGLPLRVSVVEPGPIATPLVASMTARADCWAEDPANIDDAFAPAFRAANEYHKLFMDDASLLAPLKALSLLSARSVAETCVVAAVADDPQDRYVVNTPLFALVYFLLSHLPSLLSDRLVGLL